MGRCHHCGCWARAWHGWGCSPCIRARHIHRLLPDGWLAAGPPTASTSRPALLHMHKPGAVRCLAAAAARPAWRSIAGGLLRFGVPGGHRAANGWLKCGGWVGAGVQDGGPAWFLWVGAGRRLPQVPDPLRSLLTRPAGLQAWWADSPQHGTAAQHGPEGLGATTPIRSKVPDLPPLHLTLPARPAATPSAPREPAPSPPPRLPCPVTLAPSELALPP